MLNNEQGLPAGDRSPVRRFDQLRFLRTRVAPAPDKTE